ncbi:hypothetical protein ACHWQZ_G017456 [Mnemiopsis leidyi]
MATSRLRTYKDLLTSSSDIENWFQKFRYHLLEQELIVPVAENPEDPSANETTAINAMQKKIVIHLINSMDTEMFTKLKTLVAPNDPIDQTIESIEKTLVAHLAPKPTILSERHTFYLLKQKSGEDTGHYVTKLREQAIKCKLEEAQLNERIRDQFVVGISCLEAREVLLSENVTDLTLELAFQKTVAVERSRKEAQNLGTSNTINQIRDFRSKSAKKQLQCEKCGKKGHTGTNCKVRCYYCNGYGHIKPNCPERKKDKPVSKSSYSKPYGGNSSRSRDNVQFKRTMNQNTYLLEDSNVASTFGSDINITQTVKKFALHSQGTRTRSFSECDRSEIRNSGKSIKFAADGSSSGNTCKNCTLLSLELNKLRRQIALLTKQETISSGNTVASSEELIDADFAHVDDPGIAAAKAGNNKSSPLSIPVSTVNYLSAPYDRLYPGVASYLDPVKLDSDTKYTHNFSSRTVAYYGTYPYRYSGGFHEPTPFSENPYLAMVVENMKIHFPKLQFNSAMVTKYENGKQGIPPHSDNEECISSGSYICTVSLGETRTLEYRSISEASQISSRIQLVHGDILFMTRESQNLYQHSVPMDYTKNMRISITLRQITCPSTNSSTNPSINLTSFNCAETEFQDSRSQTIGFTTVNGVSTIRVDNHSPNHQKKCIYTSMLK